MPTKRRRQSTSGFYHIFQRGVNHCDIFEDDLDRSFYLERLKRYASEEGVEIHVWCLMSNHTHLLLRARIEQISALMRRLGSVFARRFNRRHGRSGALFSERFCSVCIETDAQLFATVRYIHRNPAHHDRHALCEGYPWSSYAEYIGDKQGICKTDFVLSLFGNVAALVKSHRERYDYERHPDIDCIGALSDDAARKLANEALDQAGIESTVSHVGALDRSARDGAIFLVSRVLGCSLRQLQRLTALGTAILRSAICRGEALWEAAASASPLPALIE